MLLESLATQMNLIDEYKRVIRGASDKLVKRDHNDILIEQISKCQANRALILLNPVLIGVDSFLKRLTDVSYIIKFQHLIF